MMYFIFFKQKTAYEIDMCLEFRRVLFRSRGRRGKRTGSHARARDHRRARGPRARRRIVPRTDGRGDGGTNARARSEEHTSELQSHVNLVCRLLLEKKKRGR